MQKVKVLGFIGMTALAVTAVYISSLWKPVFISLEGCPDGAGEQVGKLMRQKDYTEANSFLYAQCDDSADINYLMAANALLSGDKASYHRYGTEAAFSNRHSITDEEIGFLASKVLLSRMPDLYDYSLYGEAYLIELRNMERLAKEAVRLSPDNEENRVLLAKIFFMRAKYREARQVLENTFHSPEPEVEELIKVISAFEQGDTSGIADFSSLL